MFEVCRRVVALCLMLWPLGIYAQSAAPGGAAVVVEKENVVEAQARGVAWKPASIGLPLAIRDRLRTGEFSRAAVRFTDLSMLRVDELTTIEISPPIATGGKQTLDVKRGGTYFFSRDKAQEIEIRTPAANGALRGTEFELRVASNGRTRLTMFDGEVELGNAQGSVRLRSGEQAVVEVGRAPRKTAVIEAVNIIQWCLYYPAVLDPAELGITASGQKSLDAYRSGDLLGALETHGAKRGAGTTADRLFRAALILSVGQVDKARAALAGVPTSDSRRQAIEQMIAAVKLQPWPRAGEPRTSSEWMAESYHLQSRSDLEGALRAARKATELSPEFGYAWARVAELEFSFGRTLKSMKVLERALELAPANAQAHSLQGFLFSAENRMGAARRSFDKAIELDGALGNAWLGRGLTLIRQNREEEGRRDLQTAAVLEPNRSILRSYLGKGFSQVGINEKANLEFARAKELDPRDPTPWLYSAIQRKQENRYNEAIDDLEKSVALNDNRRVYRSEFLLDQDRAVRSANLAAIYQNNGMAEQSVREAVRAVDRDYGNAPAHLFLANSYDALRDPNRALLRYESAWSGELLLAHMLSPVGGGPLSQNVSEQEYSKLFERNGLGLSSVTEYLSDGRFRQIGSQYGIAGNVAYALDAEYYYDNGLRPNSKISRFEGFGTFKLQLGPQDSVFLQTKYQDTQAGDVFQRYDQAEVGRETSIEEPGTTGGLVKKVTKNAPALTQDFRELQEPSRLLLGWHHEWSPKNHTLLLLGRLANDQVLTADQVAFNGVIRDISLLVPPGPYDGVFDGTLNLNAPYFAGLGAFAGKGPIRGAGEFAFDLDYRSNFEIYTAELQQIITAGPESLILGGRYQRGKFETHVRLSNVANGTDPDTALYFPGETIRQDVTVDFERITLYAQNVFRIASWLSLTGGVTYDALKYPDNFRWPPINSRQSALHEVSPKAGAVLQPWWGATLRAAYSQAISGVSFDENIRLEPTQVAGFLQTYRAIASEAVVGSVAGSYYKLAGASFEQKLPTRTYLGVEYNVLQQDFDRTVGIFDDFAYATLPLGTVPSSIAEKNIYREDVLTATINQLIGNEWSLAARYRYTHSKLQRQLAGFDDSAASGFKIDDEVLKRANRLRSVVAQARRHTEANFHEVSLLALYNHPSGLFLRGEANWYGQDNDSFVRRAVLPLSGSVPQDKLRPRIKTQNLGLAGDEFCQFNLLAGYRFCRNQCELTLGLLNVTGEDYRLDPLSPYLELPRDRTLFVRCRLTF